VVNLPDGAGRSIENSKHAWPIAFAGSRRVLTSRREGDSMVLEFLDLSTGQLSPYRRVDPGDSIGTTAIFPIHVAKDLQTFVYSRMQALSTLFVVSGWS
jgi:hypothetical protein